ncbi:hypothetical protein HYH03_006253 [Edaphochlamys debaryana]|uniref:Uncharacterized protein n=1 Tax=Edaphochlamys debaryana TaxID=47281 RepID=A0A835Y6J2_9CHLO|nr:hypothetical protein HYH03_006253 [Edaphochlamys debaryana]|eukprot:KAG2495653.1 hypothetical protein HYH03_006253 [Edaphochlamys debaryana]
MEPCQRSELAGERLCAARIIPSPDSSVCACLSFGSFDSGELAELLGLPSGGCPGCSTSRSLQGPGDRAACSSCGSLELQQQDEEEEEPEDRYAEYHDPDGEHFGDGLRHLSYRDWAHMRRPFSPPPGLPRAPSSVMPCNTSALSTAASAADDDLEDECEEWFARLSANTGFSDWVAEELAKTGPASSSPSSEAPEPSTAPPPAQQQAQPGPAPSCCDCDASAPTAFACPLAQTELTPTSSFALAYPHPHGHPPALSLSLTRGPAAAAPVEGCDAEGCDDDDDAESCSPMSTAGSDASSDDCESLGLSSRCGSTGSLASCDDTSCYGYGYAGEASCDGCESCDELCAALIPASASASARGAEVAAAAAAAATTAVMAVEMVEAEAGIVVVSELPFDAWPVARGCGGGGSGDAGSGSCSPRGPDLGVSTCGLCGGAGPAAAAAAAWFAHPPLHPHAGARAAAAVASAAPVGLCGRCECPAWLQGEVRGLLAAVVGAALWGEEEC